MGPSNGRLVLLEGSFGDIDLMGLLMCLLRHWHGGTNNNDAGNWLHLDGLQMMC
jgi:hypothetical protein